MQHPLKPIKLFISYAPEDELLWKDLAKHLVVLHRQKIITSWHRRLVVPGTDWTQAMNKHAQEASIILLLISPNFLDSDYCYGVEMKQAMEQYKNKQARVIPIILKPVAWEKTIFGHLQPLPLNARPITLWPDRDEAFLSVALGIYQIIEDIAHPDGALVPVARRAIKSPAGHTILGDMDITIGRAPANTYVMHNLEVSWHHAVIHRDGQNYVITDLASKNGTFVNNRKLSPHQALVLKHGDLIYINTMTFEYSENIPGLPAAATLTKAAQAVTPHTKTKFLSENQPESEQKASSTDIYQSHEQSMLKQCYQLLGILGQGGMGIVYLAQNTQKDNRLVAIKEMSTRRLRSKEIHQAIEQFQHEVDVLTNLKHPNLPIIYESFEENDNWYLVMSFIEGQNLQGVLDAAPERKLPIDETVRIGSELCIILEYLHTHEPQIIFRDLKPANIMVTPQGHIYLIDFGIARHFKKEQAKDTMPFCSVGYAPPEQYGQSQTSLRSDIYSLGATLHQMISGHNPANKPFRFSSLLLIDPTIPKPLAKLIAQMLEMEVQARPTSVAEVKNQLEEILTSFSKKSELVPVSTPLLNSNEQLYTNHNAADAQKRGALNWTESPAHEIVADLDEIVSDRDEDLLEAPHWPSPRRSADSFPMRRRLRPSYPNDEKQNKTVWEVPPERVSAQPSSRMIRRPAKTAFSTQTSPSANRRSGTITRTQQIPRASTQQIPRARRSATGAFSPTQTAPVLSARVPMPVRTPMPVRRYASVQRPVQRGSAYGKALFSIFIGLFLGFCLLLACWLWWPAALQWLKAL